MILTLSFFFPLGMSSALLLKLQEKNPGSPAEKRGSSFNSLSALRWRWVAWSIPVSQHHSRAFPHR